MLLRWFYQVAVDPLANYPGTLINSSSKADEQDSRAICIFRLRLQREGEADTLWPLGSSRESAGKLSENMLFAVCMT